MEQVADHDQRHTADGSVCLEQRVTTLCGIHSGGGEQPVLQGLDAKLTQNRVRTLAIDRLGGMNPVRHVSDRSPVTAGQLFGLCARNRGRKGRQSHGSASVNRMNTFASGPHLSSREASPWFVTTTG